MSSTSTSPPCCSVCGRGPSDRIQLLECRRENWPACPKTPLPDWKQVTKDIADNRELQAWNEAWKQHLESQKKDSSSCCKSENSDNKICEVCASRNNPGGCLFCKQWECRACREDQETPRIFKQVHEKSPLTREDEYGRRGRPEQCALELDRCFACQKRGCSTCLTRCYGPCDRPMCWQCQSKQGNLTSACGSCKFIVDNNDDFDIGPIDRDECYCTSCFYGRGTPMACGCGTQSYDPFKEELDSEEENEIEGDYDAPMVIGPDFLESATRWKHAGVIKCQRGKRTASWQDSYRRFRNGESPQEIATSGRQRPIQYTTVICHILEALVHGEKPDLARLAKFAPTENEWQELEDAEESAGIDVTIAPDTNMICGKLERSGLIRPIVGLSIMAKTPAQRSVPERAKISRWYHCQKWYLAFRRVGITPTFE